MTNDEPKKLCLQLMKTVSEEDVVKFHLVWHLKAGRKRPDVQRDFLKFTARKSKKIW